MAAYPANYVKTSNVGPPVNPADANETIEGGEQVTDFSMSSKRGRSTVKDSVVLRSGFLATIGKMKENLVDFSDEAMDRDNNKYAIGTAFSSRADSKVTDTRLGGSFGIGGAPSFTRYSDVRSKGLLKRRRDVTIQNANGELGQGRIYSDTIDDVQELLYLQFGVPMFNSLSGFLTTFSDDALTKLATTGKGESFMYKVGVIGGVVWAARIFNPILFTFGAVMYLANRAFAMRTSRFYTLNQQMGLYWSSVNTLTNQMVINRGILPRVYGDSEKEKENYETLLESLETLMPNVFNRHVGVDVPAIMSIAPRRTREAFKQTANLKKTLFSNVANIRNTDQDVGGQLFINYVEDNKGDMEDAYQSIEFEDNNGQNYDSDGNVRGGLLKLLKIAGQYKWNTAEDASKPGNKTSTMARKPADDVAGDRYTTRGGTEFETQEIKSEIKHGTQGDKADSSYELDENDMLSKKTLEVSDVDENQDTPGYLNTLKEYWQEGVEWAVFRVDHIEKVSESFSNNTSNNALGSGLNSVASTSRNIKFSFAGGNLGDNAIMDTIESVVSGVTDVAKGALEGFTFGLTDSVIDLLRGVNVEVPSYWEGSDAQISTSSFSMDLVSQYNNPVSDIKNIYIPLAMLLSGILPIKTGSQSHVSPFLCRSHLLGKNKSELSMLKSLSVTRGTTNLPFDMDGHVRGIKVTFELVNLSPGMSAPLSLGNPLRPAEWVLDQDSNVYEYMQMLGAVTLEEQAMSISGLQVRLASTMRSVSRLTDASAWAAMTHQYATQVPVLGTAYRVSGAIVGANHLLKGEVSR